jgi:hypothetical protein
VCDGGDEELHLQSRQAISKEIDRPLFRGRKKHDEVAVKHTLDIYAIELLVITLLTHCIQCVVQDRTNPTSCCRLLPFYHEPMSNIALDCSLYQDAAWQTSHSLRGRTPRI